ncbi:putative F-box domain-containing protein [Rosa chinensis]|uniref:Putative F-box domain-containing protein n=1 Tax=Rosa chinensis TaxID=74649 RepID=A0A2P6PEC3_ROSCH|nr:F-box protein CPR1 [Rosa chinensis]PRQ20281.1 putative F-box domain-containing protein [Rosa chinensis]
MLTKEEQLDVHLPEHVVLNILCRLPLKSLIRFTCVSKRWRSLIISDPQFANSHFRLAASQLRRNVLISTHPIFISEGTLGTTHTMLPSRFHSLDDNFSVRSLTFPSVPNRDIVVMGSCNGLVVLGKFYRHALVPLGQLYCDYYKTLGIWNPSTGFFRNVPSPSFQIGMIKLTDEKKERHMSCVYYGFGQVSASGDYKFVVIPNFGGFMEVQVFSVRANCWKVVKAPYLSPYRLWSKQWGTYSNGAVHWVSHREPGIFEPSVYAFDLASEEFREMPLPVLSHNEDYVKMTQVRTPVLVGGCLCVMFQDFDECSEFWAMKEYGVAASWVKLFRFNVRDLPDVFAPFFSCYYWDPIFIAEDGTVVIKLHKKKELVRIKCHKEEKPVCTKRYGLEEVPGCKCLFDASLYDETLVSVPE